MLKEARDAQTGHECTRVRLNNGVQPEVGKLLLPACAWGEVWIHRRI